MQVGGAWVGVGLGGEGRREGKEGVWGVGGGGGGGGGGRGLQVGGVPWAGASRERMLGSEERGSSGGALGVVWGICRCGRGAAWGGLDGDVCDEGKEGVGGV